MKCNDRISRTEISVISVVIQKMNTKTVKSSSFYPKLRYQIHHNTQSKIQLEMLQVECLHNPLTRDTYSICGNDSSEAHNTKAYNSSGDSEYKATTGKDDEKNGTTPEKLERNWRKRPFNKVLDINYLLQLHALNLVTEVGKRVSSSVSSVTSQSNYDGARW